MNQISKREFKQTVAELNEIAKKQGKGSALRGLEIIAAAFGCLLDIYAAPNPNSSQGMCDDKQAFRAHFAAVIQKSRAKLV